MVVDRRISDVAVEEVANHRIMAHGVMPAEKATPDLILMLVMTVERTHIQTDPAARKARADEDWRVSAALHPHVKDSCWAHARTHAAPYTQVGSDNHISNVVRRSAFAPVRDLRCMSLMPAEGPKSTGRSMTPPQDWALAHCRKHRAPGH